MPNFEKTIQSVAPRTEVDEKVRTPEGERRDRFVVEFLKNARDALEAPGEGSPVRDIERAEDNGIEFDPETLILLINHAIAQGVCCWYEDSSDSFGISIDKIRVDEVVEFAEKKGITIDFSDPIIQAAARRYLFVRISSTNTGVSATDAQYLEDRQVFTQEELNQTLQEVTLENIRSAWNHNMAVESLMRLFEAQMIPREFTRIPELVSTLVQRLVDGPDIGGGGRVRYNYVTMGRLTSHLTRNGISHRELLDALGGVLEFSDENDLLGYLGCLEHFHIDYHTLQSWSQFQENARKDISKRLTAFGGLITLHGAVERYQMYTKHSIDIGSLDTPENRATMLSIATNLVMHHEFDELKKICKTIGDFVIQVDLGPVLKRGVHSTLSSLNVYNLRNIVALAAEQEVGLDDLNTAENREALKEGFCERFFNETDNPGAEAKHSEEIATEFRIHFSALDAVRSYYAERAHAMPQQYIERIYQDDRFGPNLLAKFPKLDDGAQRNIVRILDIEENIPQTVDRRSPEYARAATEALRGYANNAEILESLARPQNHPVNVEAWLQHDAVSYFELGDVDELTLGERLRLPVSRLPEAMVAYRTAIHQSLNSHKELLKDKRIPEDTTEDVEKLKKLQTSLATETDAKKRDGMERGIQSLMAKIANPKQVVVWDKLQYEVVKLEEVAKRIVGANEALIQAEAVEVVVTDDASLKLASERKVKIWEYQKRLVEGINLLEYRHQGLLLGYARLLIQALGDDNQAGSVMLAIRHQTAEHADHLRADLESVRLFTTTVAETDAPEEPDDEEVENDDYYQPNAEHARALQGRPMSIRVGTRSRQDLYLGNYTTCCIRIDSDVHNDGSPIADYMTDLGMQNVILYDEVTKNPVACAWCWVGYMPATRETALVVDNIEGWQKYTVNFRSVLEAKMKEYLEQYTRDIGVEKLVQGPSYNDLDVIPKTDQNNDYGKLGVYNRVGGYYLEAEA